MKTPSKNTIFCDSSKPNKHWSKRLRFGEDLHTLPRRPADEHQSKILQLVASPSPACAGSITVYANSTQQGAPVDPLYIEDTDDWLGTPTSLETCRHQIRMYENEFEALTQKLERTGKY